MIAAEGGAGARVVEDVIGENIVPRGDAEQMLEIKKYLKEMAQMPEADYKAAMRRLFKT